MQAQGGSVLRRAWFGISSGLIAGTLAGLCEAIYILASASTGEYIALIYGCVLYGLVGLVLGAAIALPLAMLRRLQSEPVAWSLGFLLVFASTGWAVARMMLQETRPRLPLAAEAALLGAVVAVVVPGLWLGPILLRRTPLKILLRLRGTLALEATVLLLAAAFSFTPGEPIGESMYPDKHQPPDLIEHPNILLITVDSLRADHLGVYGNPAGLTPALDELSRDGIVFEQAFASAPWTRASVASIFTATPPSAHGVYSGRSALPDEVTTLAEVLSERTYVTAGLPNQIDVARSFNFQQGFDYFDYQAPAALAGATESASRLRLYQLLHRQRLRRSLARVEDHYQPAETVLAEVRRLITVNRDRRWFVWVHLMEPHTPYFSHQGGGVRIEPVQRLAQTRARYAGEIRWLDQQLGETLSWLRAEGLMDSTAIVFTADHGEEFEDHGGQGHGRTLYDEQLRVPLILRLPHGQDGGVRVPWQVRQIDLAPTIAGLVGSQSPEGWLGVSLLDAEFTAWLARPGGARISGRPLIAETHQRGTRMTAIRTGGWKYIRSTAEGPRGHGGEELYHVATDPGERVDLAGHEGARQAQLAAELRRELARIQGP